MSDQLVTPTRYGFVGELNWLVGGAVGGFVGSVLFGVVLWFVNPGIVTEAIPALYGLDPGAVGWAFHTTHGLILGAVFGFLVTREPILGSLTADAATGFIKAMGPRVRFATAGVVYGLAVWAFLPVIAEPVRVTFTGMADPVFPAWAFESLLGHLVYGLLLGVLFSVFVEVAPDAAEADAPFEEASRPSED